MMDLPKAISPASRAALRKSLQTAKVSPLWVVIYKKSSGKQIINYQDIVEEAICFGLIDTLSKSVDEQRYAICLRPRKLGGNWTEANKKIAEDMIARNKMTAAGLKAYKSI